MKGKKTGGRKAGTPNSTTKELRERINSFLSDNWQSIQLDFNAIQPRERLIFYERLLSYALPKYTAEEEAETYEPIKIIFLETASNSVQKKEDTIK
jgi:hypothetical protein